MCCACGSLGELVDCLLRVRPGSLRRILRLALNPLLFTICNIDFHQDDGEVLVSGKPPRAITTLAMYISPQSWWKAPEVS